jgi:hypothetical protein
MTLPVQYSRKSCYFPPLVIPTNRHGIRSIVGRARHPGVMVGMAGKDAYVGYVSVSTRWDHWLILRKATKLRPSAEF